MTDAEQPREALANLLVGVDEEYAERARHCSRVGHGRSVGGLTREPTATDVENDLRHSADPRTEATGSARGGADAAAARSIASGGTTTSIVVPSPGRDWTENWA